MIHYVSGNIFDSPAQTLVNPVNTVGVMGKGLALEFRRRYPNMFDEYKKQCRDRWSKDRATNAKLSFEKVLQPGHYKEVSLDTIVDTIVDIIVSVGNNTPTATGSETTGEISW